jgi:hypothetical protein
LLGREARSEALSQPNPGVPGLGHTVARAAVPMLAALLVGSVVAMASAILVPLALALLAK